MCLTYLLCVTLLGFFGFLVGFHTGFLTWVLSLSSLVSVWMVGSLLTSGCNSGLVFVLCHAQGLSQVVVVLGALDQVQVCPPGVQVWTLCVPSLQFQVLSLWVKSRLLVLLFIRFCCSCVLSSSLSFQFFEALSKSPLTWSLYNSPRGSWYLSMLLS